jgi:hypothetical protein
LGVLDKIAADPIVRWKEWPKNPQALSGKLSRNKAGVIALLRASNDGWSDEDWRAFFDERAGIAEFDGGLSRAEAEAQAFACSVDEWLNHHPVPSPPGRCLACGRGEQAHDPLVRHGIEPTKLAAFAMLDGLAWCPRGRGQDSIGQSGHHGTSGHIAGRGGYRSCSDDFSMVGPC